MPEKYRSHFRMDKLFLCDHLFCVEGPVLGSLNFDIDGLNALKDKFNCQIISLRRMRLGKHKLKSSLYPYKAVVDKFGSDYFTDTITYMIAYALYQNTVLAQNEDGIIRPELIRPLHLRLFGIDMITTTEFQASKAAIEWWLGIGHGLGCEISVSKGSVILANPRGQPYGKHRKLDMSKLDPFGLLRGRQPTDEELYSGVQ